MNDEVLKGYQLGLGYLLAEAKDELETARYKASFTTYPNKEDEIRKLTKQEASRVAAIEWVLYLKPDHNGKDRNMTMIRQGDVLIVPADIIPDRCTPVPLDNGRVVLAYGEATGHAHVIVHPDVTLVSDEQAGELRMWMTITAPEPVELLHDEHDTLLIPPGTYRVIRQREYTPEGLRNVAD